MTVAGSTTHTGPGGAALPRLDRGATVGRFLILEERGRGGMGVVYAAYDPELDRKVAVKLVRVERLVADQGEWGERLLREAQAMAKVSHPNVVTVFEVGAFEDRLFLAMELIDGPTFETWVTGRAWREIVAAYVAAGRGLAAAHAAGLVHRDFKPGNVLVAGDLPKVTDFGLAAPADDTDVAGAGTPKYMAPEQRAGEADARSDQWSFCRALEEALAGKRVPRAIRRALARGTAEDPAARFPSMVPLLAELGRDRRRATIWAAAALAVVGAGAIALARPSAAPCAQAGASVADLWTPDVEARLDATFQATGRGTAKEALGAVARHLSSFAGEARTAYRAACEATHVRHEQSEDLLDLRTSCLDAQVAEARALVGILAHADAELVGKAAEAVHRLPSPAPCADARSLLAPVRPPTDPQTRLRVAELRGALAIAEANAFVGRFQESRSLAEKVVADARTLGYRPLVADALRVVGEAATQLGDVPAGISALRESVWMAEASHHDRTAADAWTSLVFAVSEADKGLDRVDEWIERAEAAIERIGGDVHISSRLAINKGAVSYRRGNFADARAAWEKALQLEESHLPPDHPDLARAHNNLAVALDELGDPKAAEAHYERAMAIWERAFGPHNAYLGTAVGNLAFIYRGRGELARAVETMQRSVAILTTALGEGNPTLVRNQQNLGDMLVTAGRVDEGVATLERVVAIQEKARGANHPATAIALLSLGTAKRAQGKLDEAIACQERAVRIYRETQGARSPHTALAETGLGEALISKGQYAQAVPLLEGALSVFTEAYGRKHANTAYALSDLGRAYLGVGKPDKALPLLEEALAARAGGETPELAETRFLLARALWDGGGDRARAIELAEAAVPKLDAGGAADLDVKKWLAARR